MCVFACAYVYLSLGDESRSVYIFIPVKLLMKEKHCVIEYGTGVLLRGQRPAVEIIDG